jgi:hypothetical protein
MAEIVRTAVIAYQSITAARGSASETEIMSRARLTEALSRHAD